MTSITITWLKLSEHVYSSSGAINTGVILSGSKALLIDCCDTITAAKLAELGIDTVARVLFTQHRRTSTAGAYSFIARGTEFFVPAQDREWFEQAEEFWEKPVNRWHIYHDQPGPLVMTRSLPVTGTLRDGDVMTWEGMDIRVIDTPGATEGSISLLVQDGGRRICFAGDAIYADGQVFDLYSLAKGYAGLRDYHGFIGNIRKLIPSMGKIEALNPDLVVASHGPVIQDPAQAIDQLIERLRRLYANYESISSLNYSHPDLFPVMAINEHVDKMPPSIFIGYPDFLLHAGNSTTWALVSKTGAALVIDCGGSWSVDMLKQWVSQGVIKNIEGCWITHYHDDHVDGLLQLISEFHCPILTNEWVATVIRKPQNYFLPCISPVAIPDVQSLPDQFTWSWREFKLTAYDFPGQSLYHSGLLVETAGIKVFLAGDSFSPNGIDDYCSGNRNFIGAGKGFHRCLELMRQIKPDYIVNQHQAKAFRFSDSQLDYMEAQLVEREKQISELTPWPDPDFSLDTWWIRTFPYEQPAKPGQLVEIDVQITNHGQHETAVTVEAVLPEGWAAADSTQRIQDAVAPKTIGSADPRYTNPDGKLAFYIRIPEDCRQKQVAVNFRVTWDGRYLGQFRHAFIQVGL